jgi:hypothetical protein
VIAGRAIFFAAAATAGLVLLAGCGSARAPTGEPRGNFTLEAARAFDGFPLYYAGENVEGLPLVAVTRRQDTADYVAFIYGDCAAGDDMGCAPPAEIQIWQACRRNLGLYDTSQPGTPELEPVTIRGVPAAFLEDGHRLEIQTGVSTVVVFAGSRGRALRIAEALRGVNVSIHAGPLPAPAAGATEGALDC